MDKTTTSILLAALLISSLIVQIQAFSGVDKEPDFAPSYDWSIHYVNLFKQAIKEKYDVSDDALNDRLKIIAVVDGKMVDGFAIDRREGLAKIHYLYQIDWAVYNGHLSFDTLEANDEQILQMMKDRIWPIFDIESVITKEKAENLGLAYQELTSPWYNDNTWIYVEGSQNKPSYAKLVFDVPKTISEKDNKCLIETYSLETGEKLLSEELACVVYGNLDNNQTTSSPNNSKVFFVGLIFLLLVTAIIFFSKNKSKIILR